MAVATVERGLRVVFFWRMAMAGAMPEIGEVKLDPAFHELHREIWHKLKAEVIKGYAQAEGAA